MLRDKPELLNLKRITIGNVELYLYPEYSENPHNFLNAVQSRILENSSRQNRVMTPTEDGKPFVVKPERRECTDSSWISIEKEVAVARALSQLANVEFDDMQIVFEEPYGMMISDEGKFGLFRLYPAYQEDLRIVQFDRIRDRIKIHDPVKGKEGWVREIPLEIEGSRFMVSTIVDKIRDLYYPCEIGNIVMGTNGINHPDYKRHHYQTNGKPTALMSDFEMVYLLSGSNLARSISHTWTYLTEKLSAQSLLTFDQLLRRSDTIEGMVHQENGTHLSDSVEDMQRLRDRRQEIYRRIVAYTGMQTPDDTTITPGPAFEVISYIKNVKPIDLLIS